jgi:hypothetical protein
MTAYTLPVSITLYSALATEFFIRYARDRPIRHGPGEDYRGKVDIPLKRMLYALVAMTVFIFLRYASYASSFKFLPIADGL